MNLDTWIVLLLTTPDLLMIMMTAIQNVFAVFSLLILGILHTLGLPLTTVVRLATMILPLLDQQRQAMTVTNSTVRNVPPLVVDTF